jgi:ATP-dependent Zn protease
MRRPRKSTGIRIPTAHHEAGHAVLSAAINDSPERVSIRGREGTLGRSTQKMLGRATSLAQVYLAGFAAEHLLTGRRSRSLDMEVGLGLLAHLDPHLVETIDGVESTDGYGAVHQVLRSGVREVEDDIRKEVERLYEVARESLGVVWPSVKAVAEALLEEEELDRARLEDALGEGDIFGPISGVQRAHGLVGDVVLTVPWPARSR